MKNKILFINNSQFGYHFISYKYCEHLKNTFDITYMCFDKGRKKVTAAGIDVVYIPYSGGFFLRGYKFLSFIYKYIKKNDFDLVITTYFKMVSILRVMLYDQRFILDVRTGFIGTNKYKNTLYDFIITNEAKVFQNITVLSECLMIKLKLNRGHCHVVPLGSDKLSKQRKDMSKLMLLYVGVFKCRNIHETIEGLGIFLQRHQYAMDVSYDIFGDGDKEEELKLIQAIEKYDLASIVILHGRKNHEQLKPFFDICNLGVSYVPITSYFDCQPPTKTFEYINSGMPCIATQTTANKNLINIDNGILCEDTPESFSNALEVFCKRKSSYKYEVISNSLSSNTWENIINNNLRPYLRNKIKDST